MDLFSKSNIEIKIFIGAPLSTEIRIFLSQSEEWQMALASRDEKKKELSVTRHQGNEYLGFFFPNRELSVKEFIKGKDLFSEKLSFYCPELNIDAVKHVSFSQVFIK